MSAPHDVKPSAHVVEGDLVDAPAQVIVFGDTDDDVHHIREAATADAALAQFVIDLAWNDDLPGVDIEEAGDHGLDVLVGNDVAVANQHRIAPGRALSTTAAT